MERARKFQFIIIFIGIMFLFSACVPSIDKVKEDEKAEKIIPSPVEDINQQIPQEEVIVTANNIGTILF